MNRLVMRMRALRTILKSSNGHNFLVFLVFMGISTMLWFVSSLSDEMQADVRMKVKITHLPDSVTIISRIPETMSVSLNAKGTQLMKLNFGATPEFEIDYRLYREGNVIRLTDPDLKSLARTALDGASVIVVSPDSLSLLFTSQPPVVRPLVLDYTITPGPQATISGVPRLSFDSVRVYSVTQLPAEITSIVTKPLRINSINETGTYRVAVDAPAGTRVVPDSVDVTIKVEPLIFKTKKVTVESINVPEGMKLITFPSQVDVNYLVPVSVYKKSDSHIKVVADYKSVSNNPDSRMIRLKVVEASDKLQNVHLVEDSAEFYIEKL